MGKHKIGLYCKKYCNSQTRADINQNRMMKNVSVTLSHVFFKFANGVFKI